MEDVVIHEVGLRDGLQMETKLVPTDIKIQWIEILLNSGIEYIQLGSFVNPQKVPQMADTDKLFDYFSEEERKPENITFSALVLNQKGLERGLACGVDMFCMGVSASETHSMKNTGMTIDEAKKQIISMAKSAKSAGKKVQVSVQSAFGCGYDGFIPEEKVLAIVKEYLDAGLTNISLADTTGLGKPEQVKSLFYSIKEMEPNVELACHFHNTYGMGLANCMSALSCGVKYFETAFAGLGGCPFTKSPVGNIATDTLINLLYAKGLNKNFNMENIIGISRIVKYYFNK